MDCFWLEGSIPLLWELLQIALRIRVIAYWHLSMQRKLRIFASMAVRCLYARASHDLAPQAILATRSLIQLDKRARESARATAMATAVSNANTPSIAKKPEILLVSK
ncbi:hypothetical protein LOK49_LG10G01312 [Camellia lanceoleosa]|uniref:Uncharacterized protein n=1 Tax=Camellia lanceoleosa TaxID=1840588 RepID=A0ACC0GBH0_9ERIC|nr:hypothetical protein LOK49_LG10G01312 [Camellia lanceoleosa]